MDESELEVQKTYFGEADPDGMFLCALQDYPYMMTPDHISEFIGISSQEIRRLLCNGQMKGCGSGIVGSFQSLHCFDICIRPHRMSLPRRDKKMDRLRCDKPYNLDEARKRKGCLDGSEKTPHYGLRAQHQDSERIPGCSW